MQEAGETDKEWKPVAMDVTTPDYTVRNISPRKDYRFRIRASTENGDISEPTPPITFYRTQVPLMKDRELALSDYKPVEYKAIFLKHPYYEVLTKYVPPSMPIHKPDMIVIDTETIELSWRQAIVAEAIKHTCNLTYTIEVRCPPSFEWRQLVTGLKICSHTVQKLHPRIDYVFRVRAWNEYGCSEASLPVSLYRPVVYKIEGEEEMDDEEFEREWKRRYGREVPPKLPIDTPRVVTQTSDSIWFTWLPARIPAYATQTSINYVVEIREPPSTAWQRDVTDLVDCQYVREGLNPNQEYHIRVRAETEFGASDPTMPIIIRGKGSKPGSRRSSVERDTSLEDKIDLSYLDNVMSGVPPRMASSRPHSSYVGPDKLTLAWSACRTPSYVKVSNVTYIIEKRELPGHIWTVLAKDITGHKFDITGLNPEQDYMFRIRARNEFGLSEPTLPMTLYRDRDDYVPPRVRSRSSSRDSISMYVSKVMKRSSSIDYSNLQMEDDRSSQERIPCQPQYIATTYDTQYGVLGKKGKINLEVRGYPLPTVLWYRGEEKIEYGGHFNAFVTPNGGITLEIKTVGLDTVGEYKCYAENASGAAVKVVNFEIAEPPTVLGTIKDLSALKGDSVTLTCRVDGFPSPTVKWMKDWRPLTDCTRTKMVNVPPETFSLEIVQLIESDEGLYACTVENIAGRVTVTGRLSVEIDSFPDREISIKSTPIEEHYHVLEEIGRGRYGVVRRVVEISTGRTFAANFMSMRNKAQKIFFKTEFEVLRSVSKMGGVLRLYDAFETERSLIFVTEILSEPELLEKIISDGNWTEAKVSAVIKKLLLVLQELARLNVLHLDIKPSNIRMCGTDLEEIKLMGFGLSRILQPDEDTMHNYGSVGYASPEQVTNDVLSPNTDTWAVGVMAYLLLSGNGPFQGSSELEILNFMSQCSWTFEGRGFEKFSKEGLDFISKLLVKDPSKRMTVEECLNHPWMSTQSDTKINLEQLRQFYTAEKLQRETEKVFTTVQLQSFAKIIHGAKALYQPAVDIESGEIIFPDSDEYGDYLDEDAWYEWQLQYNDDPDSQIFPIQDKKFTMRECRHAGAPKYSKPKPKERSDKDILDSGTGILFTDKIQPTTFLVGEDVTFMATVVSESGEMPVVTWYRDEQLLSDDYRADASFNPATGLAKLKIVNSKDYDAAVYKCVARVKDGRVSCEARLLLGDVPSKPGCPLVTQTSGTEAFLTWNGPATDGNAYLLGYRVDYRKEGDKKWTSGPYVTEEYALLTGLVPESTYIFRVSGHNKYGASPFSWSSLETKTLGKDAPKVSVAADLQPLMQFSTFDKQQLILPAESRRPSVTVTEEVNINESDPNENFSFADTISKGSYGEYKLCTNKTTNRQCVAKIVPYKKENHATISAEFELLRTLRHANLVSVLDSYISDEQFFVIYEFLSGINIVQYFCLHKTYKEETVARLVRQVLDALQYLEHFGIVHLNLQPSSIVMATRRRPHVKVRDFTLARKVEDDKGIKVPLAGYPDYTSPEILKGDNVTFTADLWTLGALTFTMLSGISPYGGKNLEETLSHILFDRYSTKEMYDNVTEESVRFVGKLMCRLPRNRPTVTKCLNSSWLNLSESMVNARNSKMFKSEKLRAFSVDYLAKRSDLNYSLALVDIEKLPKITSGPLVQPILSDKITNRLENLTKIKREPTNLAESLKIEVSNLPEQPLLEKIVSKIEKESEMGEKAKETEVQDVEMEEARISETEVINDKVKVTELLDQGEETKVADTIAVDGIEEVNSREAVITKEGIETKALSPETEMVMKGVSVSETKTGLKEENVRDARMSEAVNVEGVKLKEKNAEIETIKVKDTESVDQLEVKEAMDVTEVNSTENAAIENMVGTDVDKNEQLEVKEAMHVTEGKDAEKTVEINISSKDEAHIDETKITGTKIADHEESVKHRDTELKEKNAEMKELSRAETSDEVAKEVEQSEIIDAEVDTDIKEEVKKSEMDESEVVKGFENLAEDTPRKPTPENESKTVTADKENTNVVNAEESEQKKQVEEPVAKETETVSEEKVSNEDKLLEENEQAKEVIKSDEVKESKENTDKKDEIKNTEGVQNAQISETESYKDTDVEKDEKSIAISYIETDTLEQEKESVSESNQTKDIDSAQIKNIVPEQTALLSDEVTQIQKIEEVVESQGKPDTEPIQMVADEEQETDKLSTKVVQQVDKLDETDAVTEKKNEIKAEQNIEAEKYESDEVAPEETLNETTSSKTQEVSKQTEGALIKSLDDEKVKEIQEEKEQVEDNTASESVKQNEVVEIVEEQLESKQIKKTVCLSEDENIKTESEIKHDVVSESSETAKTVSEMAGRKAEEIEKAVFEEIASGLKASEESKETDIQIVDDKLSTQSPVSEEEITPKLKKSVEEDERSKDEADIIRTKEYEVSSTPTDTEVIEDTVLNEKTSVKASAQADLDEVGEHKEKQTEKLPEDNEEINKIVLGSAAAVTVNEMNEKSKIEISKNLKQANEVKNDIESDTELTDVIKTEIKDSDVKLEKDIDTKNRIISDDDKAGSEDIRITEFDDIAKGIGLKEDFLKEAASEKLSSSIESTSTGKQEQAVILSTEMKEETFAVSTEKELTESAAAENISVEKVTAIESISTSESKELASETEEKQVVGAVVETVIKEKHTMASENVTATNDTSIVKSMTVKEETVSASVSEQVDGMVSEKVSVTQTHATLTTGGQTVESTESVTTTITTEGKIVQDSSSIVENTESKQVVSEQMKETLTSGNKVSDLTDGVEMVSTSVVENQVIESSVTSSLETAKVTQSRETVREFITNDDEIEEMRKEILEDLEITSAECGKYLMGSHEDISAIKDKIEKKPDEEEIEKETTNRYIDDALMFC